MLKAQIYNRLPYPPTLLGLSERPHQPLTSARLPDKKRVRTWCANLTISESSMLRPLRFYVSPRTFSREEEMKSHSKCSITESSLCPSSSSVGALPFFLHRVAEAAAFPWNFSSRLRGPFSGACCSLVLHLACQSQEWHKIGFLRFRVQVLHRIVG